ncbi:MAG: chromophore lyase CpcT/CpeT [Candidatus Cloacimonetes bacterium]|nr:chromophore lyase CpcT/CpeT [Candidatus Cloacimonadota bacterium]
MRLLTLVLLAATQCPASQARTPALDLLVHLMSGSFSSQDQALQDSSYFDIRLEMAPVFPEREDGHWLYVEQAVAEHLDRPYRQRVYHVESTEQGFISAVFEIPDPLRFAGDFASARPLAGLTPDSLSAREGCAVILTQQADSLFAGSTPGKECLSSLRGATWASSQVEIGPGWITSWDRGYDAEDQQVWGAEKGPYLFLRVPSAVGAEN